MTLGLIRLPGSPASDDGRHRGGTPGGLLFLSREEGTTT